METEQKNDIFKTLQDHFGYNFWYVADLLDQYNSNHESVSQYWQNYFSGIVPDGAPKNEPEFSKITSLNESAKTSSDKAVKPPENTSQESFQLITGAANKIIENMTESLSIPTATSQRTIPVKLLDENRRIINQFLRKSGKKKVSFTHLVAYAIVLALRDFPSMNNAYSRINGKPYLIEKKHINFGLAIDIEKKDGTRSLIVPNIKNTEEMNFPAFFSNYDDVVSRSRTGRIEPSDFQGTTISLTNPGTVGTISSIPRLMSGQGVIIAIGSIDYPAQYQGMTQGNIALLGIGKVMNITSTYDHRIIQGAESGLFLKKVNELLLGSDNFYEQVFADLNIPQHPVVYHEDTSSGKQHVTAGTDENIEKQAHILQLINIYRVRGHLIANLNPLGTNIIYHPELDPASYGLTIWDYDRNFITGGLGGRDTATLREILDILHQTYCDKIGAEYMHIQHPEEKQWLQSMMEPVRNTPVFNADQKIRILWKLATAEGFEHFMHTKYIGHKRFSLEGSETVIPALDYLINLAALEGIEEFFLGMAHRGRINVLANIIGKSYEKIFTEFEGNIDPNSVQGSGDVKYHLGASGSFTALNGKTLKISVASNPSHLEWVNPVVEGIVRAKQERKADTGRKIIIPLLIHGDAAFAGQGVVAETINLSLLPGYRTGGTIHLIINNQIGFTTNPEEARSTNYASDVAKMVQAPIFHVNGDDPEKSLWAIELAFKYRQKFNKDVVIDLFGYRKHGHNEGDDPAYTQPIMYRKIKDHPAVRKLYEEQLIAEKIITPEETAKMREEINTCLTDSFNDSQNKHFDFTADLPLAVPEEKLVQADSPTYAPAEELHRVIDAITTLPEGFEINPKLKKILEKRRELLENQNLTADWAFAEALAFGTLLLEGTPVRLSGQDSARGTFSQRHLILSDINSGEELILHNHIPGQKAAIEPLDSLLSEAAVLGFEYGYSAADPLALVIWEAQFGDFANSAQVIIDNFIASGNSKWKWPDKLVLLLPHGYEGQGPEHSSARIERFLSLCAEENLYVCNASTPAQYFHLLRRQVKQNISKPLIIFTPKSLLRLPEARSPLSELSSGEFLEVIDDETVEDKNKVDRLVLVSGKLYYDLLKFKTQNSKNNTALVRIEQLYPLNTKTLESLLESYKNAGTIVWAQEEPRNNGAWHYMAEHLQYGLKHNRQLIYAGRNESASPSSGVLKIHQAEQQELIRQAME